MALAIEPISYFLSRVAHHKMTEKIGKSSGVPIITYS
jgi:hypothetical protein